MPLNVQDALERIYSQAPVVGSELLPIENALGYICAKDVFARYDLPRFDNSAMDGYGVKCCDGGKTVRVTQVLYAGDQKRCALQGKEAIKIMTGAAVVEGIEAIVPIEDVERVGEDQVKLPKDIKNGKFIRKAGEDICKGSVIISKGEKITPFHIAVLASQGITHIDTYRKVRVAVFSTGDELKPHFESIQGNQLFNSNTPMFMARCEELGAQVRFIRSSADTPESLRLAIENAMQSDIILTSGGISMGDKDFTKEAFGAIGANVLFEGVRIKPGRPTTVAQKGDTLIVNLPGNPLAAMVNFELFMRAAIRKMGGLVPYRHGAIVCRLAKSVQLKPGVVNVKLGRLESEGFVPISPQKPGMLSPLLKTQGMVLFEGNKAEALHGMLVNFIPISWELTTNDNTATVTD